MRKIISRNPFTGQVKATFPFISDQELGKKLDRSASAYEIQKKRTLEERGSLIKKVGQVVEGRLKQISQTITFQMGKPINDAQGQVKKVVSFCNHYASQFHPLLPQKVKTPAKKYTLIKYLPIGTIYYMVPFNFPFFLTFKGGLANLLIGNTLLARNADSCPNVGRLIEEVMIEAGFNSGQFQNVYTDHHHIDQILSHQNVQGVSFTGSSKTGALISQKAGKYLKKAVMELGGNDPFVVLQDGDVNLAVSEAIRGRCFNSGQVCFSPKRFIIHKKHYEKFRTDLIDGLTQVKAGDPMDRSTKMGPLARQDLYDTLQHQLENMPKSYKMVYQRMDMKKPFFPITVIEGSDEVWDEELFGPVYQLFRAQNEDHALELANHGSYGLGSSVFSASKGQEFSDRIRSGMGFVNGIPASDYSYPTGGVSRSGFGRECGSEGYKQFANIKTHYVN